MTNEEINKWLINLKDDIGKMQYQPLWHYAEALDMAIEALTHFNSIKNELNELSCSESPNRSDLIRRQGMCDSLNKYRIEKMLEGKDVSLVWECIDKVLQEPSVQLKPKTAESGSVDSEQPEIKTDRPTSGDLISRQDAIDALGGEPFDFDEYEQGLHAMWQDAKESLERLPSAHPEVIRCKDCAHNFDGLFRCDRVTFYNEKDDFCSKAKMKRRDEENETD